jgi:hypothetical protein
MLDLFAVPQMTHLQPNVFFEQDVPPHWDHIVRQSLNKTFPNRWIWWVGPIPWPPHSPDIIPLDFFFWGYVKDEVFFTKLVVRLNFVHESTMQLILWHSRCWKTRSIKSSTVCELQMALTLRSVEPDEFFFQVK